MKKLMILMVFGTLIGAASGCHVTECWKYAWNSRFHPERNAPPCVMADPCDPCGDAGMDGAVLVAPGPVLCN